MSRFSSDVIEMFYGPISHEENVRLQPLIRASGDFDFQFVRTNFNEWLHVWKMAVPEAYKFKADLLKFAQKTRERVEKVIENEIKTLKSIKMQFGLNVKFLITRDCVNQEIEHYFKQRDSSVFNRNNAATVNSVFCQFIDEAKGEIEAWSQRSSGWVVKAVVETFISVAQYQPFHGGSYIPPPKKLENKKAIINVKNRDNQCLRWPLRVALFPPRDGMNVSRPSRYPTEDGLNFTGINFPMPISEIKNLE